jgi:hypothetical protein
MATQCGLRPAAARLYVCATPPRGNEAMASERLLLACALLLAVGPANAADPPVKGSKLLDDLKDCRAITEPERRLACYDSTAARLADATAKRDVIVVDREDVRKTRRSLFGFSLPNFSLFGGKEDDEDKERVTQLDAVAKSVREAGYGAWRIVLDDGAVWETSDPVVRAPKTGSKIRIKAGAFTSYKLSIDGGPAVKARRVN